MPHRYDKYDPVSGGFRAPLALAWPDPTDPAVRPVGVAKGVGLNGSGQVVIGDGSIGARGVLIVNQAMAAGEIVDVMTDGEIADFDDYLGTSGQAASPGDAVVAAAGGDLSSGGAGTDVGFVVATNGRNRFIVRIGGAVT